MNKFNWKSFFIWFSIFYLFFYLVLDPQEKNNKKEELNTISLQSLDSDYVLGNTSQFKIVNNTNNTWNFKSPCENSLNQENLIILGPINSQKKIEDCTNKKLENFIVQANQTYFLDFKDFNPEFFTEAGKYKLKIQLTKEDGTIKELSSKTFEYEEPGFFRSAFRFLISYPLFNALVFITNQIPGHSFGIAIIILTILIRLLLFFPNQKAMSSQRKLQKLQPKMEELKKKYGKNQQMMAMKTMEMYKREKINPMSSCLPILLQMPFLLGLYFVIQDGVAEHLRPMLYSVQENANLIDVDTNFMLWDLSQTPWDPQNLWLLLLPIFVGIAQFLAIYLTLSKPKTHNKKSPSKKSEPSFTDGMADQMAQMQKMMLWIMPLMIGFFTITFPAGVGLYWLVSTIFGVGQQKLVNYNLDKPQVKRKI